MPISREEAARLVERLERALQRAWFALLHPRGCDRRVFGPRTLSQMAHIVRLQRAIWAWREFAEGRTRWEPEAGTSY